MIAVTGKSLRAIMNEIYSSVGTMYYDRIDMKYEHPNRSEILPRLSSLKIPFSLGGHSVTEVRTFTEGTTLTGVKFYMGKSQWLLIRTSQTEPLVRIYAEGQSGEEVKLYLSEGKKLVLG
jgi:phosphomannomutase